MLYLVFRNAGKTKARHTNPGTESRNALVGLSQCRKKFKSFSKIGQKVAMPYLVFRNAGSSGS